MLIYYGTVLFADLQFLLGSVIGVIYTVRNCRSDQSLLKYGLIVGILGGVLSSVVISLYQTLILSITSEANIIIFLLYLGFTLLSGVVIGLLTGAILGTIYVYRDMKGDDDLKNERINDDFYNDLIGK